MIGNIEFGKCDFCHEEKPISRYYVHPKNKVLNGNSAFVCYCNDCGIKLNTIKELRDMLKDEGYYVSWKANIAMSFKDTFYHENKLLRWLFRNMIHKIANEAADKFLKLLMDE